MPADPTPPPQLPGPGPSRRRPVPSAGNNWGGILLLALIGLVFLFALRTFQNSGVIDWSEFWLLVEQHPEALTSVTFRGSDQVLVEVGSPDKVPESLRAKLRGKWLSATRLRFNEDRGVLEKMQQLA